MTTTFDPETTTIVFSDKYAGPIPKGYLHLFPKLRTVYLGKNMKQKIGEGEVPNKRFALFFAEGYPHLIGENIPREVAVVIHGRDHDAGEPEKFPTRPVFFEYASKTDESGKPGYFHSVPIPKAQRQLGRITDFYLQNKILASAKKGFEDFAKKGFEDFAYDPRNNWLIASIRDKNGKVDPEMTYEIRKFSDYWNMFDESEEEEVLSLITRDDIDEEDSEEPRRPAPIKGVPVRKPAVKKSVTDIEVLVTRDDITEMHKRSEEKRAKEIKDAEEKRLERIKIESKDLALKIKGDLDVAYEQDYLRKEYSRQYILPDRERTAVFERLKKHLPGFTIARQGKCAILVSFKIY